MPLLPRGLDPLTGLLFRLVQLLRDPPRGQQALILIGTIVVIVVVVAIEQLVGWPSWLAASPAPVLRH